METQKEMAQNEIDEYIEKRKAEDTTKEDVIPQSDGEDEDKDKGFMDKVGKVVQTGASVISAIPHVTSAAIGAGAATLIPKLLEEMRNKKK